MCQPVRAALSPPPAPSKEAARPQLDAKPLSFIRVAAQALGGGAGLPSPDGGPALSAWGSGLTQALPGALGPGWRNINKPGPLAVDGQLLLRAEGRSGAGLQRLPRPGPAPLPLRNLSPPRGSLGCRRRQVAHLSACPARL